MVKGLIFNGFILLALSISAEAQVYLPKKCYMHLVGRVDTEQEITMNLVKVHDSLYADLVFSGADCNFSVLAGKINADGSFEMHDPFCDTGMMFQGNFVNRQSISGTCILTGSEESHPFVLVESYPAGSIPLLVYFQHREKRLADKQDSPKAEISQCLIVPGESSNPVLSDSLRIRMISDFTGKKNKQRDPDKAIQSNQETFLANYLSSNESLYQSMPDAGSLNWLLLKYMHVLYNDNDLLTYYLLNYGYTGGAHGMETHDFRVVSIKTGQALSLKDLFSKGFEGPLTALLTTKLKRMLGVGPNSKLTDSGYFVDEVVPTENFYVTGTGIGFVYNHYEIAPYSYGLTDILLRFDEMKQILLDSGALSQLLSQR